MIVDRHAHTYITTTLIVIVKPTSLSSSCILGEYISSSGKPWIAQRGTGMGRRMALEGPLEPAGCTAQSLGDTAWGAFFWYVLSNPEKKVPFYTLSLTKLKTSAMNINITCVLGSYYYLLHTTSKADEINVLYIFFSLFRRPLCDCYTLDKIVENNTEVFSKIKYVLFCGFWSTLCFFNSSSSILPVSVHSVCRSWVWKKLSCAIVVD